MAIKIIIEKLRKSGYSDGFINRALVWLKSQPKAFVQSLTDPTQYIIDNEYLINHTAIAHEHECSHCHKPSIPCRAIGCEIPKFALCLECCERGAVDDVGVGFEGRRKKSHGSAEPQTYRAPYGPRRNRRKK
jgi:hypothetical protein